MMTLPPRRLRRQSERGRIARIELSVLGIDPRCIDLRSTDRLFLWRGCEGSTCGHRCESLLYPPVGENRGSSALTKRFTSEMMSPSAFRSVSSCAHWSSGSQVAH